jgi:hypothetical protein
LRACADSPSTGEGRSAARESLPSNRDDNFNAHAVFGEASDTSFDARDHASAAREEIASARDQASSARDRAQVARDQTLTMLQSASAILEFVSTIFEVRSTSVDEKAAHFLQADVGVGVRSPVGYLDSVPLGPHVPAWKKLYDALAALGAACGGAFAFVIDEGNGLWCVGLAESGPARSTEAPDRAADRFYRDEMVPRLAGLRGGVRMSVAKVDGQDRYVAESFAGIYAVVVWFGGNFQPELVRARVRRALPEIEALTLALPPPGGPGGDEAAAKLRA